MGQAVAFGEEVWAGHGEHRLMQARRQIRRLVDTFGARGSGRHGGNHSCIRVVAVRADTGVCPYVWLFRGGLGAILIEAEAFLGILFYTAKIRKKVETSKSKVGKTALSGTKTALSSPFDVFLENVELQRC